MVLVSGLNFWIISYPGCENFLRLRVYFSLTNLDLYPILEASAPPMKSSGKNNFSRIITNLILF